MFSPSHSVVHRPSSRQTSHFHFALHHFGAVTVSLLNPSLKQNPLSLWIQIYQSEMTWLAFPRTLHHWCGPLLTINLQRSYIAIRLWKIFLASAHLYCVLVRCNECIHVTNKHVKWEQMDQDLCCFWCSALLLGENVQKLWHHWTCI